MSPHFISVAKDVSMERYAPQIKNAHPIPQPRPLHIKPQHRHLRLRQRLSALRIQITRILHPRAQHSLQHTGTNLVVLFVGLPRLYSDWPCAEEVDILHLRFIRSGQGYVGDEADPLAELGADAAAEKEDGEVAAVYDVFD